MLFANFAEAMAEGRGKAQAATLRRTRAETLARKRLDDGSIVEVPSAQLVSGDLVVVGAGSLIPADGDVVEGIATVDESAITGEIGARDPRVRRRSQRCHGRDARPLRPDRRPRHRATR